MPVVILRQQHRCAEVNRVTPPLAEDRALDADALHLCAVGRRLDRRDYFVRDQLIGVVARGSKETRTGSP